MGKKMGGRYKVNLDQRSLEQLEKIRIIKNASQERPCFFQKASQ
jgi:hypothetical protein